MISYELALELKNAGFPCKGTYLAYYVDGVLNQEYSTPSGAQIIYIPTLSELIEACEGHKKNFQLTHFNGKNHGWVAKLGNVQSDRSATPEEAVAKLWLALNEK